MKYLIFATVSVLLASSVLCQKELEFRYCDGSPETIQHLFVTCENNTADCELQAEKNYIFDVRFISPMKTDGFKSEMFRDYSDGNQVDFQDSYSFMSCPLEEGEDFTFYQALSVSRDAPRGPATIRGKIMTGRDYDLLVCYETEVVYVDYKA